MQNKIIKTCLLALIALSIGCTAKAESFDSIIKKSPIDASSTIAVSVKNVKTGKVLYQYNQDKLMNPASALKVFTMKPAYDILGSDFRFKTQLFKDSQNNLYIKLSGDPTFTTNDLKTLLANYKGPVKDIIIDPSATDYLEWGIGWMWDDDTSPYFPKYSQYTINQNMIPVNIKPGIEGKPPEIKNRSSYPTVLVNLLTNGSSNHIKFSRMPWRSGDITLVEGTVNSETTMKLPVDSTEGYFISCLKDALYGAHLKPTGTIKTAPVSDDSKLIAENESDSLQNIISATLKNSININTELIFKAAGGRYTNSQGSTLNGMKMFDKYYSDLTAQKPALADASGTSRNDLISADWMSEALIKFTKQQNFDEFELLLAKPIEGTLSNRLLNISRFVRAKTGTNSGISSLTGYVTAKSGEKYSFAIIIQNFTMNPSEIKALEDRIVTAIYSY